MSAITDKYAEVIKTNPAIGKPTVGGKCPDGKGEFQHYEGNASIYWTPETGAHLIYGLIRSKWAARGWERGPSGYPVSDELDAAGAEGRYNAFQNGVIIWKRGEKEAFVVLGAIFNKWQEEKAESGFLGYPLSDETKTPDGIGRFNHFAGGSIYWTPETGAHSVQGLIRKAWADQGWERSRLQYPTSDESVTPNTDGNGRYSHFEGGQILWTQQGGAVIQYAPETSTTVTCAKNLGNDKLIMSDIRVKFTSYGRWAFHVYLNDVSSLYGDKFQVGFVIQGDGHAAKMTGTIGAGDAEPREIGGTDPWIEKNWHKVRYHSKVHFRSVVEGDLGWLDDLFDILREYAPEVIALIGSL